MDEFINCALPYGLMGASIAFVVTNAFWHWRSLLAESHRENPLLAEYRAAAKLERQLKLKERLRPQLGVGVEEKKPDEK